MLSNDETNHSQKPIHTVLEESKAKRDTPSDDPLTQSIKPGTCALIRYFIEFSLLSFQSAIMV